MSSTFLLEPIIIKSDLLILTGRRSRNKVEPNNTCLGFNNFSCWAQGNHQLYIVRIYVK